MKKYMIMPFLLMVSACASTPKKPLMIQPIPAAQTQVAVCDVTVKRKSTDMDTAHTGMRLEEQNTVMRKSLAQMKEYTIELEASFVECGGKIK